MKDIKFEDAMRELEEISDKLSAGNASLDEMMKLYTRGMELSKHCRKILSDYEAKLEIVDKKAEA